MMCEITCRPRPRLARLCLHTQKQPVDYLTQWTLGWAAVAAKLGSA